MNIKNKEFRGDSAHTKKLNHGKDRKRLLVIIVRHNSFKALKVILQKIQIFILKQDNKNLI